MAQEEQTHKQHFLTLVDDLKNQIDGLVEENRQLKKENQRLKEQVQQVEQGQTDIFSVLSEKDRMTLRHQINGLIEKIDHHLEQST